MTKETGGIDSDEREKGRIEQYSEKKEEKGGEEDRNCDGG